MATDIKAILLDVDGTLTNDQKDITPRTRDALLKCQEKGVVLVLASGRTANGLSRYAAELQMERHGGVLVAACSCASTVQSRSTARQVRCTLSSP